MKNLLTREIATSFTTILFIIISLSGILMFFHLFDAPLKELHEILGIGFVLAALFHVMFNFSSMKRYFTKKVFIFAGILGILVSSAFIVQSVKQQGENPKTLLIQKALDAPLDVSFALLNISTKEAFAKLERSHIILKNEATISQIAQANKTSPFQIVSLLNAQ